LSFVELFKIDFFFISVRVAIKNEDTFVGAVCTSLDGIESWLDLILKLTEMKVRGKSIEGVKKILLNETEVKVSDKIPNTNLDSIIAVCVLNETEVKESNKIPSTSLGL
jgi:hypothetical protein